MPMPVRMIRANDQVKADSGLVAVQRGPVLYCIESVDYKDGEFDKINLRRSSAFNYAYFPDMLSGVTVIKGDEGFTAIPYYAWANRGDAKMAVWLKSSGNPPK
jgi:DUF1680 family protein